MYAVPESKQSVLVKCKALFAFTEAEIAYKEKQQMQTQNASDNEFITVQDLRNRLCKNIRISTSKQTFQTKILFLLWLALQPTAVQPKICAGRSTHDAPS